MYGEKLMKIKIDDNLLIIYLYNQRLNLDESDNLTKDIKELLVKVIRYHKVTLSGIYEVVIYENVYYGYILEIARIKEFEYSDFIDLKLDIKRDQSFYLLFENYDFIDDCEDVFYKNNFFFVNIKDVLNVNKKVELCEIAYKNTNDLLLQSVKVK